MNRLPIAIGSSAFLAVTLGAAAFLVDSGPIAQSSAAMILFGLLGVALGGLSGLLLVRAPWARWLLGVAVLFAMLLASIGGSGLLWIVVGVGATAIIGLGGPWLTLWVRQQPVTDQLGTVPVSLIASGAVAPVLVGFASYQGVGLSQWALVMSTIASAWAYGRGLPFGIWGFRAVTPIFGLVAVSRTGRLGSIAIAVGTLLLVAMAWSSLAKRVTAVITPPLPSPVSRRGSGDASR